MTDRGSHTTIIIMPAFAYIAEHTVQERGARTTRPIKSASREGRKYSRHSVPGAVRNNYSSQVW